MLWESVLRMPSEFATRVNFAHCYINLHTHTLTAFSSLPLLVQSILPPTPCPIYPPSRHPLSLPSLPPPLPSPSYPSLPPLSFPLSILARDELHRMLNEDELRESVLLVFANKQDLPNAMSAAEMTDKLGLHNLRHRQWYVQYGVRYSIHYCIRYSVR